jgi:hypothetical protein
MLSTLAKTHGKRSLMAVQAQRNFGGHGPYNPLHYKTVFHNEEHPS